MRDHPDSRRIVTLTGRLAAQHGHVRQLADAMVKYLRRLTPQERVIAIEAILYERRAHYAALYAHHFGVDLAADPPALVAGFRGPLRDTEDGLCSALALLFTIHDLAYAGLVSTRHEPVAQRARIALAHYLAAFLLAPLMDAQIVARESPSAMERESATYSVAGWVRSRISLSHDPDLRRAAHEYNSAATIDYALIEALPAAVLTALDAERDEAWDCDRFFRRALAELRRRAPRKTQSRTDPTTGETVRRQVPIAPISLDHAGLPDDAPEDNGLLASLLAEEERTEAAAALQSLLAGASRKDRELLDALKEQVERGEKTNIAEIERALGLKAGTGRQRLFHLRKRLKTAI